MNVSVPVVKLPAGIVNVYAPLVRGSVVDVYPPPDNVTVPVGVGKLPEPATVTARERL